MKTWILAAAIMMGFAMNAQPGEGNADGGKPAQEQHTPLKPAQRADLKLKKLTLDLNLNEKQQKEFSKLLLAHENEREQVLAQVLADRAAGKKLTADEKYAMESKRLDAEITTKNEAKKILTAEQFSKYEQLKERKRDNTRKDIGNFKKEGRK